MKPITKRASLMIPVLLALAAAGLAEWQARWEQ